MRHRDIEIVAALTISVVAAPLLAEPTLTADQEAALLQNSGGWQVSDTNDAYDWQPPETVNALIVFRPFRTGARVCLAGVVPFEGLRDASGAFTWRVSYPEPPQYYFWTADSCEGLVLRDAVLLHNLIDSDSLQRIWAQRKSLVVPRDNACSADAQNGRVVAIELGLSEVDGIFYRANLEVPSCGSLAVEFRLVDGAIQIMRSSYAVP